MWLVRVMPKWRIQSPLFDPSEARVMTYMAERSGATHTCGMIHFFYCLKDKTFTASAFSVNADNAYRPINDRRIAFVTGATMGSLSLRKTIRNYDPFE